MPTNVTSDVSSTSKEAEYLETRELLDRLTKALTEAAVETVWSQWATLGGTAASKRPAQSIVDPEALVLLSLFLSDDERRLKDLTSDWVAVASNLLSTQRLKNLMSAYPASVETRVAPLAQVAIERGKDARWKTLAVTGAKDPLLLESTARTGKTRAERPSLVEPAALLLRLRQAFGVGIKADTLGFLLGTEGAWATARVISAATGYTTTAVRRSADEMSAANVIASADDTATLYRADSKAWGALLRVSSMPAWRSWHERFVFVAAFLDWAKSVEERRLTRYAVSVKGRELFEAHRPAFERNHVVPWDTRMPVDDGTAVIEHCITSLIAWMQRET
jgi:hypothetical protein